MSTTARFTLLVPLMFYGQIRAKISVTNQLRGPVLASGGVPDEYIIWSDEVVAETTGKVNLIILTESGCPDCKESIAGPLNGMITSHGFADIINVRQFR